MVKILSLIDEDLLDLFFLEFNQLLFIVSMSIKRSEKLLIAKLRTKKERTTNGVVSDRYWASQILELLLKINATATVQCKRSVTDNLAFARILAAISWRFRIYSPNEGRGEITRINGVTRFPRHGRGINHGAVVEEREHELNTRYPRGSEGTAWNSRDVTRNNHSFGFDENNEARRLSKATHKETFDDTVTRINARILCSMLNYEFNLFVLDLHHYSLQA